MLNRELIDHRIYSTDIHSVIDVVLDNIPKAASQDPWLWGRISLGIHIPALLFSGILGTHFYNIGQMREGTQKKCVRKLFTKVKCFS